MLLNVEECLERYGSFYGIAKRVRSGELVKLERGLYSDTDEYVSGERRVAKKHPAAVFTMESAFLFHGLSDVVPDRHSLATPRVPPRSPTRACGSGTSRRGRWTSGGRSWNGPGRSCPSTTWSVRSWS